MKLKLDYKDFLCDDLFVYWRTRRTVKLTQFWEDFINKNEHLRESFELAIATFDEIQKNKSECIIDEETVNRQLQDRIYHLKKRKQLSIIVTSVAASLFITIISTIYILTSNTNSIPENQLTSIGEVMSQDKIQLISGGQSFDIENNSMVQLTEGENALIHDSITQKQIDLKNNQNKLIVPFGKRSSVILADGSLIHLNSGTEMEFPSAFSNQAREIKVKGEIFIEVTKQSTPFIIHTPKSQITVFGTSFNVSAYTDEESETVVLVEGSVQVKNNVNSLTLKPGEMAILDNNSIHNQMVDVTEYVSWKNGYMNLNKNSLTEVLRKIGRYYNVEFHFDNTLKLKDQTCSGKLYLSENINDVLESFSQMTFLKYYIESEGVISIKKE